MYSDDLSREMAAGPDIDPWRLYSEREKQPFCGCSLFELAVAGCAANLRYRPFAGEV